MVYEKFNYSNVQLVICLGGNDPGVLNLIYIHPVPGLVYLLLSILFIPPVNEVLRKNVGFSVPFALRIILFLAISWFTLGISDLAEMYGL